MEKSAASLEVDIRRDIKFYVKKHPLGVLKVLAELVEKEAAKEGYADDPAVRNAILKIKEAEAAFHPIYER